MMPQAFVFERFALDELALGGDHPGPPEVDIGWGEQVLTITWEGSAFGADWGPNGAPVHTAPRQKMQGPG